MAPRTFQFPGWWCKRGSLAAPSAPEREECEGCGEENGEGDADADAGFGSRGETRRGCVCGSGGYPCCCETGAGVSWGGGRGRDGAGLSDVDEFDAGEGGGCSQGDVALTEGLGSDFDGLGEEEGGAVGAIAEGEEENLRPDGGGAIVGVEDPFVGGLGFFDVFY